jgi:hypothetical protein
MIVAIALKMPRRRGSGMAVGFHTAPDKSAERDKGERQ